MPGLVVAAAKILGGLAAAYVLVAVALYLAQTWLLFPAWMTGEPRGDALPARSEGVTLTAPDGTALSGFSVPPAEPAPAGEPAPILLGFGGNAWTAETLAGLLARFVPEHQVLAFDYRGYGASGGRASAAALLADGLTIYDWLARRFPERPVVAVGLSIGSAIAAHLAANRPVEGLVLVTPFDSLTELAKAHYPWLPVGLLLRHRMPVAQTVSGLQVPAAVIAAGADTVVPPARTQALRAALPAIAFDRTIPEAGHNDLYAHPDFAPALRQAVERVAQARTPAGPARVQ